MEFVNYYILGELLNLLERIELIDNVDFSQLDPDSEADLSIIVNEYLKPQIAEAKEDSREKIRLSLAYYAALGVPPFQAMKDRCQELSLPDPVSWRSFFHVAGKLLFGDDYNAALDLGSFVERPDEREAETLFRV